MTSYQSRMKGLKYEWYLLNYTLLNDQNRIILSREKRHLKWKQLKINFPYSSVKKWKKTQRHIADDILSKA
jgi:hypothetical protein